MENLFHFVTKGRETAAMVRLLYNDSNHCNDFVNGASHCYTSVMNHWLSSAHKENARVISG